MIAAGDVARNVMKLAGRGQPDATLEVRFPSRRGLASATNWFQGPDELQEWLLSMVEDASSPKDWEALLSGKTTSWVKQALFYGCHAVSRKRAQGNLK